MCMQWQSHDNKCDWLRDTPRIENEAAPESPFHGGESNAAVPHQGRHGAMETTSNSRLGVVLGKHTWR